MLKDRWIFGRKAKIFTLQWHLTNECENQCLHCYDRSDRGHLQFEKALLVISDFHTFCRKNNVHRRISLTGGNPLLYPFFWDIYSTIARKKIAVSILGNPVPADVVQGLLAVRKPIYYQVSLEGLKEHNDEIRGEGHFDKTMQFLRTAWSLGLRTHVMLTLTRSNMDQVIPLGGQLRGLVHRFTFNRLSRIGGGSNLDLPRRDEYVEFLKNYIIACRKNRVFGIKDNLFNIYRRHHGHPLSGGCTGVGCGAAFSFVALLPDGEVHACRKYPSKIGNILNSSLQDIYFSEKADQYRRLPQRCKKCKIWKVCGGCPAVVYAQGLDPFVDRDPHCFVEEADKLLGEF